MKQPHYIDIIRTAIATELSDHPDQHEFLFEGLIDADHLTDQIRAALSNAGYRVSCDPDTPTKP